MFYRFFFCLGFDNTGKRTQECICVGICITLMAVNSIFIVVRLRLENLSSIAVAAICGIITADFGSGFVHWAADSWGSIELPIIGKVTLTKNCVERQKLNFLLMNSCFLNYFVKFLQNFLRPFREHHIDPTSITRHDFIETNGDNFMVTIPFLSKMTWDFLTLSEADVQKKFLWTCYWFQLAIFVALTNQVSTYLRIYCTYIHNQKFETIRISVFYEPTKIKKKKIVSKMMTIYSAE